MTGSQKNEKEVFWKKQVARWQESGISRKQFCQRESISYWTFRDWQKKFEANESCGLIKLPARASFDTVEDKSFLEIFIHEKASIRITKGFNGELLRDVLNELGVRI